MDLSPEEQFVLSDSSSSNDSDEERFFDSWRQQMAVAVLAVKEFEDRYARRRQGSKVGRLWLTVRQIRLEVEDLMINSPDRILEATTKLGHVEHIMNIGKIGWQLQLIR